MTVTTITTTIGIASIHLKEEEKKKNKYYIKGTKKRNEKQT